MENNISETLKLQVEQFELDVRREYMDLILDEIKDVRARSRINSAIKKINKKYGIGIGERKYA